MFYKKNNYLIALQTRMYFFWLVLVIISICLSVSNSYGIIYSYDSLNRLTKADYGGGLEISYTYDAAGNRLTYSDIDTTVVAWGNNDYGQTDVPADLKNVIAVAAGDGQSLALRADGTVVAWGRSYQTAVPAGLSNVIAVAAGSYHSLALRADGTVVAWSNNGNVTTVPAGLSNVVTIAGGENFSLALRADGTVVAWGDNSYGQTDVPAGLNNVVAVACTFRQSLALRADGTVVAWGSKSSGSPTTAVPAGLSNVVAVATGYDHSLALLADGTVVAWGDDGSGQTDVPSGLNNVVAVATGYFNSLALLADGTVVAWGDDGSGQTDVPVGLSNVVAVAAGSGHSLALLGNLAPLLKNPLFAQTAVVGGTATFTVNVTASQPCFYQWQMNGTNLPGATGKSLVLTNVTLNQANSYSVIVSNSLGRVNSSAFLTVVPLIITTQPQSQAVVLSGTASFIVQCQSVLALNYQWRLRGTNLPGATSASLILTNVALSQAGGYTVIVSNSAGSVLSSKGALTVNLLAAWGDNSSGQTTVPVGLSNVVAVAAGVFHSLALRADGTVVAWGDNYYFQATVPAGLSNVVAVAAGYDQSMALRADGTVVAWGYNDFGQTTVPAGLSNVVAVAAGDYHSLALRADGTVVGWGNNESGQLVVPNGLTNVVTVAAGGYYSLALQANGIVVAWGNNGGAQTTVPSDLNNVIAVAAEEANSLALRADGTVVAWGYYYDYNVHSYVPMTAPEGLDNVVAVACGEASLVLRADGTMVAWGDNSQGQTNVPSLVLPIGGIACGDRHSLAALALGPPFITSRLANREGSVGGPVFFRVEANGAAPLHYQWQRNGVDLPGRTNALLQWTSISASNAGDYSVIVSNGLGVATIPSAKLSVNFVAMQTALDNNLPWSTDVSSQGWFAETSETHDGVDAAQSGAITDSQFSWLDSSVVGPGTLTFWWKVSSEPDYDFLEFYLDGVLQPGSISGEVPWQKQTYSIPVGSHTLRWSYAKDISDSFGQDAGWLDEVHFTPPFVPTVFGGGLSVSNGTFNMRLTGSAGAIVVVESSFNLITWTPMQTNTLPADGLDLAMPMGTNQQQFFRARIPQP
jgi:YD repeat-containing protein